jgi:hypothetical protein
MTSTMVAVTGPAPGSQINNLMMMEVEHPHQAQFLRPGPSGPASTPLNPTPLSFNYGPQMPNPALYGASPRFPPNLTFLSPQVQQQQQQQQSPQIPHPGLTQGSVFTPSPSPSPSPSPFKRQFTPNEAKSFLQNQLKNDFPRYWDLLKQFIAGKLTKSEFDTELKKFLPEHLSTNSLLYVWIVLRKVKNFQQQHLLCRIYKIF